MGPRQVRGGEAVKLSKGQQKTACRLARGSSICYEPWLGGFLLDRWKKVTGRVFHLLLGAGLVEAHVCGDRQYWLASPKCRELFG
jgi:hypothetical protein